MLFYHCFVKYLRYLHLYHSDLPPIENYLEFGFRPTNLGGLIPNDVKFRGKTYFKTVLQIWKNFFPFQILLFRSFLIRIYLLRSFWIRIRILFSSGSRCGSFLDLTVFFFYLLLNIKFFFQQTYPQTYKKVIF